MNFAGPLVPQAAFVYRNHYPDKQQLKKLGISKDKIRLLPLGSISMDSISLDNFYQVCGPIWRAGGHVASHTVSCRRSRSCAEPTCVASSVH